MEFSNLHVYPIVRHKSPVLHIGHFQNNDDDHFFSISDNSELKEWLIPSVQGSDSTELETNTLLRPCSSFLSSLGHVMTNKAHRDPTLNEMRVTSLLMYENLIVLGYEDGLVLVWRQERRDVVPKKMLERHNSLFLSKRRHQRYIKYLDKDRVKNVLEEMKNRNLKNRLFDDNLVFNLKDDTEFLKCSYNKTFGKVLEEEIPGENDKKFDFKSYYNIMWLKYIFVGQTQEISNLFVYHYTKNGEDREYLLSSSRDCTVFFYDLKNGEKKYSINIVNSYINYVCVFEQFIQDKNNRRKKIKIQNLNLIANTSAKIIVDFNSDEKPLINNYSFQWNTINKLLEFNKKFYLLGNDGQCIILRSTFQEEAIVMYPKTVPLIDMIPFRNMFLFLTGRLEMGVCMIDLEVEKKIIELFKIKIGFKRITNLLLRDEVLYLTSKDTNVYSIDVAHEYELYERRCEMKKEEKLSEEYNKFLESRKNKKKKRGKSGKKGKGKGVKKSPAKKKSPSPAKKGTKLPKISKKK